MTKPNSVRASASSAPILVDDFLELRMVSGWVNSSACRGQEKVRGAGCALVLAPSRVQAQIGQRVAATELAVGRRVKVDLVALIGQSRRGDERGEWDVQRNGRLLPVDHRRQGRLEKLAQLARCHSQRQVGRDQFI